MVGTRVDHRGLGQHPDDDELASGRRFRPVIELIDEKWAH